MKWMTDRSLQVSVGLIIVIIVLIFASHYMMKARQTNGDNIMPEKESTESETANAPPAQPKKKGPNHLALEKSPYLLQHADNPVDWYPWSEGAFAKAERENKPIFLSIGYSTCHWCHVMERESFEDIEVAALMNDAFVCIKVDREERPDIDDIYMTVCQMMTGGGGWPLTIIMTPDKKPFFAATYIPKRDRYGRTGLFNLIPNIKSAWINRQTEVLKSADQAVNALKQAVNLRYESSSTKDLAASAFNQLASRFDAVNGGFGDQPKFPSAHNLLFLIRYWHRTGDEQSLRMAETTLQKMRSGGIFDQIGFGFHRYSTDSRWFIPHFEKMLYDQAMLAMAYTEAYQATGNKSYRATAEEILEYVLRDMTDEKGAFYSAEDADSDGEEGKFYMWSLAEINKLLSRKEAEAAAGFFGILETGNLPHKTSTNSEPLNVLAETVTAAKAASDLGIDEKSLNILLESARSKLFASRSRRIRPYKDDKILTDWNGLMIAALAKASRAFDEEKYLISAKKAAGFIVDRLEYSQGGLLHRYRSGDASIRSSIDDYVFFIWAMLELYEASFDASYLEKAVTLNNFLISHFWDEKNGGFFYTPDFREPLLARNKQLYDGAIPSGNSAALFNILRIARLTADPVMEQRASAMSEALAGAASKNPAAHTFFVSALDYAAGPSVEIVIVGSEDSRERKAMIRSLNGIYMPGAVVLSKSDESQKVIGELAPFTRDLISIDGRTTAYVCQNHACDLPVGSTEELMARLR